MKRNQAKHRARFVSPAGAKTRGRRLAAYRAARKKGLAANRAARSAVRKVPFTSNERKRGSAFQGVKARPKRRGLRPNPVLPAPIPQLPRVDREKTTKERAESYKQRRAARGEAREKKAKRSEKQKAAARRNIKKAQAARRKKQRKAAKGKKKKQFRKVKVKRRVTVQVPRTKTVTKTKRVRIRFGNYKRVRMMNPRTGRVQYSYMYRDKKGRLRRIPTSAVVGKSEKKKATVRKGRQRAARKIMKQGGAFVANKRRKTKTRRKARKGTKKSRRAAAKKAAKTRALKKAARSRAARKAAKTRRGRKGRTGAKRMRRKAAAKSRRRSTKSRRRSTKSRRKARKGSKRSRSAAAKLGWRRRKARGGKRMKRNPRRRTARMKSNRRRTRRVKSNRRRTRRTRRTRRLTPNQVKSLFVKALKVGGLATLGFLTHRLLTSLVVENLLPLLKSKPAETTAPEGFTMDVFEKPLVGVGMLAVGLPLTAVTLGRGGNGNRAAAVAVGSGMVASALSSLGVALLHAMDQPRIAAQFEGYNKSMAYALRGRGYSGLGRYGRGVGQLARRTSSIMPRYAPVGQFRQASAGMGSYYYKQAAAGTGEYFTPSPMGEYFVPGGVQGVGQYEAAGPLAMQAAAGFGQTVDDGIRPDTNLDRVMDLAESAAGYRGMGEYFTAARQNSGYVEERVPTQNQSVPSGPLWAGTLGVRDTGAQSEMAAGILAGPGGNGILSGG